MATDDYQNVKSVPESKYGYYGDDKDVYTPADIPATLPPSFGGLVIDGPAKLEKVYIEGTAGLIKEKSDIDSRKDSNPKDAIGISKVPLSTVSAPVLAELGVAMLEGSLKYGRHNYRVAGVRASVYYDATMRHLMAFWEGEDIDSDSGMSHLVKAMASLTVLRDGQLRGLWTDNRPPRTLGFISALNKKTKELLAKYDEHKPPYTIEDTDEAFSQYLG